VDLVRTLDRISATICSVVDPAELCRYALGLALWRLRVCACVCSRLRVCGRGSWQKHTSVGGVGGSGGGLLWAAFDAHPPPQHGHQPLPRHSDGHRRWPRYRVRECACARVCVPRLTSVRLCLRVKGESAFERLSPEQQIAARAFKLEFELSGIHLSDDKRKKVGTRRHDTLVSRKCM
jgi:hypothetical protein